MKNVKKMIDEADESILDELIKSCEQRMGKKFAPKEEESEEEPEVEVLAVESDDEDDMDEEKMAKLMEMYKSLKG
jgi:hypothetical protein